MPPIYVPSTGPDDWRWLLAQPGLHWKRLHSAFSLAHRWEAADRWPPRVQEALSGSALSELEPLICLPEHQTSLPGGSTASQTDLLVVARQPAGPLAVLAVEGKYQEPFGPRVDEWRSDSPGKRERLAFLLSLLGLPDDDTTAGLRYQLLHRAAAAILEARRFGAADAVLLVHSFDAQGASYDDFVAFGRALGVEVARGALAAVDGRTDPRLHLSWVADEPPHPPAPRPLGERFDHAVAFARDLHATQSRKGTEVPYVAHLLAVASLVIEDGGTEDQAIAAVLHDAVEDQGGMPTLQRVQKLYGAEVARIVLACSDTSEEPKPPWRRRKEAYIQHLLDPATDAGVLRVSLADKLHNARAILFDLRESGPSLWTRFRAGRADQLWYYDALADAFTARAAGPMAAELRRTVDAIAAVAGEPA